jgi:hypothetical protein
LAVGFFLLEQGTVFGKFASKWPIVSDLDGLVDGVDRFCEFALGGLGHCKHIEQMAC